MRIDGSVVMITGASEGVGAACAAEFRRRGARIALVARTREKLDKAAAPDGLALCGDVTDEPFRTYCVEETLRRYGQIDILINNAGIGLYAPSWIAPMHDVRAMMEVNFFAVLGMIQSVTPHMRTRRSGLVVNVGSIGGKVTLPWLTVYSASKHAISSLTNGLRVELSPDNIGTMLVCPGYVQTGFQDHVLSGKPPAKIRTARQFAITAERCARDIAHGVERNARTVVTPSVSGWLFVFASRLFPSMVDAQMGKIYHSLEHS